MVYLLRGGVGIDMREMAAVVVRWGKKLFGYSQAHNLNPNFFLGLSIVGTTIHLLYYLPWFKASQAELAFLVILRTLALVGPAYILLKGRGIARALNLSLLASWTLGTAWHVCYFVYL